MKQEEVMSIYDEIDENGITISKESIKNYSVLSAFDNAIDEELLQSLDKMASEDKAHTLHAYLKNALFALRSILQDSRNLRAVYSEKLRASLHTDLENAKKTISEQISKLQEL